MCGIVGIVSKRKKQIFDICEVEDMRKIQNHRGPNDSGVVGISMENRCGELVDKRKDYEGKSIVAFNRLSILDLSNYGHQPMMNEERNVILAFNGEVYNYQELRLKLLTKNYIFRGNSDTEIILNLYLEYGIEKMLAMLNGMFAIVIYDLRIGQVYFARDRFGIKPLYVANTEGSILYSSEMKSFIKFHEFEAELNEDVLQEYILFRNSMNRVLLKNVEMVCPGELWKIDLSDNSISKKKIFEIDWYKRRQGEYKQNDIMERMWSVLNEAVKRQMLSDVNVGSQLSGGVDSSLISYIAAEEFGLGNTFSIVVGDNSFSEEKYLDWASQKIRAKNHKYVLDSAYYAKTFTKMIWHFENIAVHASTLGIYMLAEMASKHVTVLLSGEGCDEVFGGYRRFTDLAIYGATDEDNIMADKIITAQGKVSDQIARRIYPQIDSERYVEERKKIYMSLTGSPLDKQIKYEMYTYLPELLVRQDKMTMAHSIENRVPMLDNKVVEFAFQIPEELLLDKEKIQGKAIIKKLTESVFGTEFAYRKKMGFGIPTNKFLVSNYKFTKRIIENMKKREIVNGKLIEEWSNNVPNLKGTDAELFLKMYGFEIWCELFLDKKDIAEIEEGCF